MVRTLALVVAIVLSGTVAQAGDVRGFYLETRTCQVYTGPCFANSEMGLTGRDAIMAWHIDKGTYLGTNISGLNVVVVVRASQTLGHQGLEEAGDVQSVVLLDAKADQVQREALLAFARCYAGRAGQNVVQTCVVPIDMSLDLTTLVGTVRAGDVVKLQTRKARLTDCICSNEVAFYPPLTRLENFVAGITTIGEFHGTGLGVRWSTPESRSAYMATFRYRS